MVGFLRGFIKGIMDNSKDPKVAAELVVKKYGADYGLDLGQQTRENELLGPMYYPLDDAKHPLLTLDKAFMTGPMAEGARHRARQTSRILTRSPISQWRKKPTRAFKRRRTLERKEQIVSGR